MKKYLFPIIIILILLAFPLLSTAEEIELINRPVNTSGLTGLLFTTAPYTMAPGVVEIGASVLSENSVTPDYRLTQYPLTVTTGISPHSELALRFSYFNLKEGPSVTAPTEGQAGNIELTYKWNFLYQDEGSPKPSISFILTGILPVEKNSNTRINDVTNWGMRVGISVGSEIGWKEHILGIYGDVQLASQDLTEERLRDVYEIVNAGLLFPISKNRNLQMFIEYTLVHDKDKITVEGGDYSGITYGLRMVGERVNVSLGAQFLRKSVEGYDNTSRVIGQISVKFGKGKNL
jgi:hypothetical protein